MGALWLDSIILLHVTHEISSPAACPCLPLPAICCGCCMCSLSFIAYLLSCRGRCALVVTLPACCCTTVQFFSAQNHPKHKTGEVNETSQLLALKPKCLYIPSCQIVLYLHIIHTYAHCTLTLARSPKLKCIQVYLILICVCSYFFLEVSFVTAVCHSNYNSSVSTKKFSLSATSTANLNACLNANRYSIA